MSLLRSPASAPTSAPRRDAPGRSALHDSRVRALSVVLVCGSVLWLVLLWVLGGGVQDLRGWTTGLLSGGRLIGLVASDLLLVQVAADGACSRARTRFGQDRLARLHRLVGFTSFT